MARILVAEDDSAVREFVDRSLRHDGHEVVTAHDGLDALDKLHAAPCELLITDIVMPGMDGIALALKVAKDFPDVAIVLMTGYAAERQRAHNLEILIHRVLAKPFTLTQLCAIAAEALAVGR